MAADVGNNLYYRGCVTRDIREYKALMWVEQNLTESQKQQVRDNIGLDISTLGSMAFLNYRTVHEWEDA